ncbi:MAG: hypothetical protein KGH75_10260 [Rhodospirillales bacterium]|nr:hypothetical protein [Rhodospirillales bacterium]
MKIGPILASALLCLGLAGCDTYTGAPYPISISANTVLKTYAPAQVTLQPLTSSVTPQLMCRLDGPIHLPGDVSPETYFTTAFSDQFELAGLSTDKTAPVTISGEITRFDFSSMIGDGTWNFGITLNSSNGHSLSVSEDYHFAASFVADAACHNVADAYAPAVQALVEKAVNDPGFAALLGASAAGNM